MDVVAFLIANLMTLFHTVKIQNIFVAFNLPQGWIYRLLINDKTFIICDKQHFYKYMTKIKYIVTLWRNALFLITRNFEPVKRC